jgi:alpha-glucosidase
MSKNSFNKNALFSLILLILIQLTILNIPVQADQSLNLTSPDGNLSANLKEVGGSIYYNASYKGSTLLNDSQLGLNLSAGGGNLIGNFALDSYSTSNSNTPWTPAVGFKTDYDDNYKQLTATFRETVSPNRLLRIYLRAYNEGLAFKYEIPTQSGISSFTISAEKSNFNFTANHYCWKVTSNQGTYSKVQINSAGSNMCRPLVVEAGTNRYLAITEAGLYNYAAMLLSNAGSNNIQSSLGSSVTAATPFASPWRAVLIGETPQQLMDNHYLTYSLSDPCAISDTSWIEPGTAMRDSTLTYTGVRSIVDFSVAHQNMIKYVLWDAGWYGDENSAGSNPMTVNPNRSSNPADCLLPESISYAHAHGMKFILYINHLAMENFNMDQVLSTYQSWGVDGVKYGFVNHSSQTWEKWVRDMIVKAAQYRMVLSIHDEWRPMGYNRTYPNLLGAEGYDGDEGSAFNPANKVAICYARVIAGVTDLYPKYYHASVTSHAFQLALPVVFFNPISCLFWYDMPSSYQGEPEIEFWEELAKTKLKWDDSKYVNNGCIIGECATVARKSGSRWYIGSITRAARTIQIPLTFLDSGKTYTARIYKDGGGGRTNVAIEIQTVTNTSTITATMPGPGGYAILLTDNSAEPTPTPAPTATPTPVNLALGKTATASSDRVDYPAGYANDGNTTTRWNVADASHINDQWLEINFGAPTTVNKTVIKEISFQRITSYKIQYYNGSSWVDACTGTTAGSNKVDTFATVTASKVRLYIVTASNQPTVNEFEVYNSGGVTATPTPTPTLTLTPSPTPVNLALGKTATASSDRVAYPAGYANDGNTSTRWNVADASHINDQWLEINFGTATTFNKTVIKEISFQRITSYKIQYYNGTSWVDACTGTTAGSNKVDTFAAVTASKVRLYIVTASDQPTVNEFEVY